MLSQAMIGLSMVLVVGAAPPTATVAAPAPGAASSVSVAAARKPRGVVSGSYVRLPSKKLRVSVKSNAKKVKLTYRSAKNKKRSATIRIHGGRGSKTLAAGAHRIYARAKATSKLRRGLKVAIHPARTSKPRGRYPWHTGIVATTFWVGEIFDPNAEDGSQMLSTYDAAWFAHYGGCDGVATGGGCATEARTAANGYFPRSMKPKQNPFYLDLPFDDVNDEKAFARRGSVIPWAKDPGYAGRAKDRSFSYMKNRWVQITRNGRTCFGQIEDAGPGQYNDATYVFGKSDARPLNKEFNGAGMDVSPALNGCLGFAELNGESDRVSWRFVDARDVPRGPWRTLVTTSPVSQ